MNRIEKRDTTDSPGDASEGWSKAVGPPQQVDVSTVEISPQEQLAAIVHDVNNELVKLSAGLDVMRSEFPHEHGLIKLMCDAVSSIEALSYKSIAVMRGEENFKPVDTHVFGLVTSVATDAMNTPWSQGVKIITHCQYTGSLRLDPVLFGACLQNLIKNACEAMQANFGPRELRIQVFQPWGDKVCFRIADNGPGIPENVDVFKLGVTSSHRKQRGYGLASVRQAVCVHGGQLKYASSPAGTAVEILLPAPDIS